MAKKEILEKYTKLPTVVDQEQGISYMKCPVCEKVFAKYITIQWAYKLGNCYYCSWGCKRKAETLVNRLKGTRGRKPSITK